VSCAALLAFAVIVLLPILYMLVGSVFVDGHISLANYASILSQVRQLKLLFNTVIIGLGTTLLALLIGVPLGFLIGRTDSHLRKALHYLYLAPLVIPPYMSAVAWTDLLGKAGVINKLLMRILSLDQPLFTIYGLPGCFFILSLSYFPFVTLLTLSGLASIDNRLEESASLSHGRFGVIKNITLPLIMPHVLSGALFVFIFAISDYGVPDLLRVNTYPVEIFVQFSAFYKEGIATALSVPLIVTAVGAILLIRHDMGNRSYVTLNTAPYRPRTMELGKWKKVFLLFICSVLTLSVVLPLGALLARSGSLSTYVAAFRTAHAQILTTAALGVIAATAMVLLSFPISYIVERAKSPRRRLVDALSLVPFAVPATVLGIGLIGVWNRPATRYVYGSSLILVLGYIARFIPFVVRSIGSNLKQIHVSLEEAALQTGGSWLRRVSGIVLPLCRPGIIAGWCLAYIFSAGELGTTLLVTPPGEATLPIRIYTLMHYGANQLVAALCIMLIALTLAPVTFLLVSKNLLGLTRGND
jgi:iron(III) transport system permease protein